MSESPPTILSPRELDARIHSMLETVACHCGFTGVYHSMASSLHSTVGRGFCRLCRGCLAHSQAASFCHSNACTSALQGHSIGDVWYFRCWLGVDGFAVPVAPEGDIVGAVEFAGWFSCGERERSENRVLSRLANLDSQAPTERYVSALQAMPEVPFEQVRAIAEFALQTTFSGGLNRAELFEFRHRVFQQQQRLNMRLQNRPAENSPQSDVGQALTALAGAIRDCDRSARLAALDGFLCAMLLEDGRDLDRIRAGLASLLTILLRQRICAGDAWKPAMTRFEQELMELDASHSIEEVFVKAEEWILHRKLAAESGSAAAPQGHRSLSHKTLTWMQTNHAESITVQQASEELGASVSSITHQLKKETGKGFSAHLRTIRVNEAKRLLAYTDLTLAEIAGQCGFNDPSYFTKVFRAEINLTPSEFLRMLS